MLSDLLSKHVNIEVRKTIIYPAVWYRRGMISHIAGSTQTGCSRRGVLETILVGLRKRKELTGC
jgi:hypothetical protein